MSRFRSIALSLATSLIGLAVAGSVMQLTGWLKEDGNLTWAFVSFLVVAVPEYMLIRRYTSPTSAYFRLDGEIFPFFSIGVAAAVLIFKSTT